MSTHEGLTQLSVDFEVEARQIVALFGKSGAGKTTLLRMLAGLTQPARGFIQIEGEIWYDSQRRIQRPVQQRNIGFVFQDYALFPHMSVRRNLEFALLRGQPNDIVDQILEITELTQLQHRKPPALSGGQQQRVALARALVRRPRLLLMDEPLSALDWEIRQKLRNTIAEAHQKFPASTFLVSHDIAEVVQLADQVLVIDQGKIVRAGKPREVFEVQGTQEQWGLRNTGQSPE
ncbi:MAG: ABC transporter ATP-binding protein [Bacteroidia bacterium]|nr:ABC transporter ATP-binding protein [Bacteroidia bacterium]